MKFAKLYRSCPALNCWMRIAYRLRVGHGSLLFHPDPTRPTSDMELGHWVAGLMGHLGHRFSLGHRVPGSSL